MFAPSFMLPNVDLRSPPSLDTEWGDMMYWQDHISMECVSDGRYIRDCTRGACRIASLGVPV